MKKKIAIGVGALMVFLGGYAIGDARTDEVHKYYFSHQQITSEQTEKNYLDQINNVRKRNNLPALVGDPDLEQSAKEKAEHMLANKYWAHVSPDGVAFNDIIWKHEPDSLHVGENLARCFPTATRTVSAWEASDSHMKNMVGDYTRFGTYTILNPEDKCLYTVNHFAK